MSKEMPKDLLNFLSNNIGSGGDVEIRQGEAWNDMSIDAIAIHAKTGQRTYIEIAGRANLADLAHINLFKDYIRMSDPGSSASFVLLTRSISPNLMDTATSLGIRVLVAPRNIIFADNDKVKVKGVSVLTSEKSWKVVTALLKARSSSIRRLSITEKVSYGWTYSTVQSLLSQNIAKKEGNMVSISDVDKLLNGVAWERPTGSLVMKEVSFGHKNVHQAAAELTSELSSLSADFAFASYIAGTMYTGQGIRHDSLQIYLKEKDVEDLSSIVKEEKGEFQIMIQVLRPDRGVFDEARTIDGIKVTSPSQTLLDLAGLGYKAKDLAKAMVEVYGNL